MGPRRPVGAAYLDASAVVKLLSAEPESEALDNFLTNWPLRVSSELLRVELACVCHRQGISASAADKLLYDIRLLRLTPAILRGACERFNPPQRALDALHLASAERAREQLGCLITYDSDQAAAASARGWHVERPA